MIWVCHVWKLTVEDEQSVLIFDSTTTEPIIKYCKEKKLWIEKIEPLEVINLLK